jgi:hypothetical protein
MYRYLNLPQIPNELISNLNRDFDTYETSWSPRPEKGNYFKSKTGIDKISEWCKNNVCESAHWDFQIIKGDMPIHTDAVTVSKLMYLIDTGGDNVVSEFYNSDKTELLESVVYEKNKWILLRVDIPHRVKNINPGSVRFSITGRMFPY